MDDRQSTYTLNGVAYTLKFSNLATLAIDSEYGSLDQFLNVFRGFENMSNDDLVQFLPDVFKVFCILANQSVVIHNFEHPEAPLKKLHHDYVAAVTDTQDIPDMMRAVISALNKGLRRDVPNGSISSGDAAPKNALTG